MTVFSGDPAEEHPDANLRGRGPCMELIACGPEQYCWDALRMWTDKHPLRMWECAEVVARSPELAQP